MALLEVVAEDLLVLADALAGHLLEPVGELLVQLRAELLRGRAVGGVADEDVLEAVRGLAGEARGAGRTRSLPASRCRSPGTAGRHAGSESSTTAPRWKTSPSTAPRSSVSRASASSRSRRAPSSAFRLAGSASASRSPFSRQLSPDRTQHALVDEHRHELLGEQRVAGRRLREPLAHARRRVSEQALEQRVDVAAAERLEPHRDRPVGPLLEQLGPGQAEQQDRSVA